MSSLEELLPDSLLKRCVFRRELGLPYPEVLEAIDIASAEKIAVLGLELFQVEGESLLFVTGSGYDLPYGGQWDEFVRANNAAARDFVANNRRGEGFVYILTSTTSQEYYDLTTAKDL